MPRPEGEKGSHMPVEMNKEARLAAIDKAIRAAEAILETLTEMLQSFDAEIVDGARRKQVRLRNQIDDLRVIRLFIQRAGDFSPLSDETAQKLDALGRELEESTRASNLANAELSFLARAIQTATQVGQILDERPKIRTVTSSPGTSAQSA